MSSLLSAEEVHRTAAILEGILDELSWPEDAEHILRIQSTLDIIQTGTFRKLAVLAEKGVVIGQESSRSKVPSSQVPLSAATAPDQIDQRLVSPSDGLEGVAIISSSRDRDERVSSSTDVVKEGHASSEHVPLSVLSPSQGTSVDSGIQDSVLMKERILTDPFQEYDAQVIETSFSQSMMNEIEKRLSGSHMSSPNSSAADSPLHQPIGGEGETDTPELQRNGSQVMDSVSPMGEGWLSGGDYGHQATEQLGALDVSTSPEDAGTAGEGQDEKHVQISHTASVGDDVFVKDSDTDRQEAAARFVEVGDSSTGDVGPVDVLFPMRSKESFVELQEAVMKNQLSISALQSPDSEDNRMTWEL